MSSVLLVLHDLAPETWPDYRPFIQAVDALGKIPMTHLVVPDFHHRNRLEADPGFCRLLDARLERGDELALHGFYHCDDGAAPRTPRELFMRRIYTHEGEFYELARQEALDRLNRGLEVFGHLGWPVQGFVAPAWLMSEGTRQALKTTPLRYTSDPNHFYRLPDFTRIPAPGLVWSAGRGWRRGVSRLVSDWRLTRLGNAPTLRLGLHPVDMRHRSARRYWLDTLERLLAEGREPLTKARWLDQVAA